MTETDAATPLGDLTGATADEVAERLALIPLAAEGGRFRRLNAGPADDQGRPAFSEIALLLTGNDHSALHRLPLPETWHYEQGDPVVLLLLAPDGLGRKRLLGPHPREHTPSLQVPSHTWMGAHRAPGPVGWSLLRTTMQPGFVPSDYEPGGPDLAAAYPSSAEDIRRLCGSGARMGGTGDNPTEAQ